MSPPTEALQRISRLAPLSELMARLVDLAQPVPPKEVEPAAAVGATLAADVAATVSFPASAIAMRDGWAMTADLISDAGPYSPAPLSPQPDWVETGERMPAGTDAVLPLDAVTVTTSGAEAHASAIPGEGVLPAGADVAKGAVLRRAGERLRPSDVAILRAARIENVSARAPRVKIFCASVATRSNADTISSILARAIEAAGGIAEVAQAASLESALLDRACDAIVTIGGTGTGRRDASVKTLARVGKVEIHGFGIAPGETAALGSANSRPVLMLPGRLDASIAIFLAVGCQLVARLAGRGDDEPVIPVTLAKKITSTVGLAEVVLVRRAERGVEPLASGFFPWNALARADGWILVPPESEGFAEGAAVEMRLLP
ncbi:MAG: molybdopterin-binding protein [Xanthobacteraceae bacterium]